MEIAEDKRTKLQVIQHTVFSFYISHILMKCVTMQILTAKEKRIIFNSKIIKEETSMQAYCVKCRAKKEMKDPKTITMKNKKPATQGVCPACGTKMFRIGK